jgi:hypothetical protein
MKIFQIYYKPEQKLTLDSKFIPYDNTENPSPDLREWYIWNKEFKSLYDTEDYWGFVSSKFKEKSNLTGDQVFDHISKNPGVDVYLFNPCIANEALFANPWEQGDIYHPNISNIANTFLHKIGYPEINVRDILMDSSTMIFTNYIVGSKHFWKGFMEFSQKLFDECEKDKQFKDQVFGVGASNYALDGSLSMFSFLIERLVPTYLILFNIKTLAYKYSSNSLSPKYNKYIADTDTLSTMKVLINKYGSSELFACWNHFRLKLLQTNPEILTLE